MRGNKFEKSHIHILESETLRRAFRVFESAQEIIVDLIPCICELYTYVYQMSTLIHFWCRGLIYKNVGILLGVPLTLWRIKWVLLGVSLSLWRIKWGLLTGDDGVGFSGGLLSYPFSIHNLVNYVVISIIVLYSVSHFTIYPSPHQPVGVI